MKEKLLEATRKMLMLLTQADCDDLVAALRATRGDAGFTTKEASVLLSWANKARFNAELLKLVLDGRVSVDVVDGELVWREVKP